jgi:hypothetical protein
VGLGADGGWGRIGSMELESGGAGSLRAAGEEPWRTAASEAVVAAAALDRTEGAAAAAPIHALASRMWSRGSAGPGGGRA